jgi:hypothetical protein
MTTSFHTPPDDSWNEAPGSGWSRLSLRLGWLLVVLWGLSLGGFALWQLWTGPERLLTKLLAFGGISGFALLALSVLLDRLESYRTDRYRRVEK